MGGEHAETAEGVALGVLAGLKVTEEGCVPKGGCPWSWDQRGSKSAAKGRGAKCHLLVHKLGLGWQGS